MQSWGILIILNTYYYCCRKLDVQFDRYRLSMSIEEQCDTRRLSEFCRYHSHYKFCNVNGIGRILIRVSLPLMTLGMHFLVRGDGCCGRVQWVLQVIGHYREKSTPGNWQSPGIAIERKLCLIHYAVIKLLWKSDPAVWPDIQFGDIYNFLIYAQQ